MLVRLVAALAAGAVLLAQQSPDENLVYWPSRLVEIPVVATGPDGPIGDLKAEDFTLRENGVPRPIVSFRRNPPAGTPDPDRGFTHPGWLSNVPPRDAVEPAGPVAIVIDLRSTRFEDQHAAKLAVVEALSTLEPSDRAGVFLVHSSVGMLQPLGSNSTALLDVIDQQSEWPDLPAFLAATPLFRGPVAESTGAVLSESSLATASVRNDLSLRLLADHMARIPGRKSILWIGDYPSTATQTWGGEAAYYPLKLTDFTGRPYRLPGARTMRDANQGIRTVATDSGGLYFFPEDLHDALERVRQDAQASYTLGYMAEPAEAAEPPRDIRVTTSRPDIKLRYRTSYDAFATDRLPGEMVTDYTARSGLDATRIRMRAHIAGRTSESVAIEADIDTADIRFIEAVGWRRGRIDLMAVAHSADGSEIGRVERELSLGLDPDQYTRLLASGLRVEISAERPRLLARPEEDANREFPVHVRLRTPHEPANVKLVLYDHGSRLIGSITIPVAEPANR